MKLIRILNENRSVEQVLDTYNIKNYTINKDGSVDVDGDVRITPVFLDLPLRLERIPIKFRYVSGHFSCPYNNLVNLEGAPLEVGGSFVCHENKLTTLRGSPREVHSNFHCERNLLTDLQGAPRYIGGNLFCPGNLFTEKPDCSSIKIGGSLIWRGV